MTILCILLIIFSSIECRNYDSISTIKSKLFQKIKDISIKFEIKGKQNYIYKLASQNINYEFFYYFLNDVTKEISIKKAKLEIIFNLSLYNLDEQFVNIKSDQIFHTELIKFIVIFSQLRLLQVKQDFSFDAFYEIANYDEDTIIFFENINEMKIFKYLIFKEKDEIYNNKTLYDFMKIKIVDNIITEIRKILLVYPECDSLYHFNSMIDYFPYQYKVEFVIGLYTYYKASINFFDYKEINKIDDIIYLQNITAKLTLIYFDDYGIGYEDYDDRYEIDVIQFKYISINNNLTIEYGELTKGLVYVFDTLKQIINSIQL